MAVRRILVLCWTVVFLAVPSEMLSASAGKKLSRRTGEKSAALGEKSATATSSTPFAVELWRDFQQIFRTRENLLILGIGAGASAAFMPLDEEIAQSRLNSELHGGLKLDGFFEAGEILGAGAIQMGGAAAAFGLGKLTARPELRDLGSELLRAQLLTQGLTFAAKKGIGRQRPDGSNRRSYPSGHASGAFATASVLQRRYGWKIGTPAYTVAAYIAGSRLNEGRHYLSDVIMGAALGILVGRSVSFELGTNQVLVQPFIQPDARGIHLQISP